VEYPFAIPHAKTNAVKKPALIAVKFDNPIEWQSMDGEPIKAAVALFAAASDPTTYLGLLSKVAVMLADETFRISFLASSDVDTIAAIVAAGLK
jgi:PTS system fructose-specific IIA component